MTPPSQDKKDARQIDFEKTLEKLEQVIAKLEEGELPLEESVKQFERGTALLRDCQAALSAAEQKVKILVKKSHGFETEAFEENGKK